MDVDRFPRDEQRRVRVLDVVDHVALTDRDVAFGKRDVLIGDRRTQIAFAAAGQLLTEHEHVHVRVCRIQGVDGPLPDRSFQRGWRERSCLRRLLANHGQLRTQGEEVRVARDRGVHCRLQRQRGTVVLPRPDIVLTRGRLRAHRGERLRNDIPAIECDNRERNEHRDDPMNTFRHLNLPLAMPVRNSTRTGGVRHAPGVDTRPRSSARLRRSDGD